MNQLKQKEHAGNEAQHPLADCDQHLQNRGDDAQPNRLPRVEPDQRLVLNGSMTRKMIAGMIVTYANAAAAFSDNPGLAATAGCTAPQEQRP